ncbi:MAG: rod shape-determining protein MreC [Rubrivivax sp.]
MGTLESTTPPFFRQGLTPRVRLAVCAALAVGLMLADARWHMVDPLRAALATAMQPVQRALAAPLRAVAHLGAVLGDAQGLRTREEQARAALAAQSLQGARAQALARENAQLRALLELRPAITVRSQAAEVLYEAADPFARKVVIDRGALQGVAAGSPVVNEAGLIGQVTRVHPLQSEVSLLSHERAAVPVLNERTGARAAAYGGAREHGMELRFVAANADVKVGDVLVTSGLDGIYPPGLRVARVAAVDRLAGAGFAGIGLAPLAPADGVRHVLVLEPTGTQLPPRPDSQGAAAAAAPASQAASRPGARAPRQVAR